MAALWAGRARFRQRDRDWRARLPLTAGPGQGLGAGPRAPPPPHGWQTKGTGKQTHNKETEADLGGSRRPRTVRAFGGQRSRRARVDSTPPPPPIPSNRCGPDGRATGWEGAPLPGSQPGPDVQSLRASYPCPLIIGFVTGTITALPRAWFRMACSIPFGANSPVALLFEAINPIVCAAGVGWRK